VSFGEFCFTFRVKNLESKNVILSWSQFFVLENHYSMQVGTIQIKHVRFILIYCVLADLKLFKIHTFAFIMNQYTFHVKKLGN